MGIPPRECLYKGVPKIVFIYIYIIPENFVVCSKWRLALQPQGFRVLHGLYFVTENMYYRGRALLTCLCMCVIIVNYNAFCVLVLFLHDIIL